VHTKFDIHVFIVTAVLSDSTHHCALWQAVPGFKMSVVEVEFYMMIFDM